jgi:hypothetical protein
MKKAIEDTLRAGNAPLLCSRVRPQRSEDYGAPGERPSSFVAATTANPRQRKQTHAYDPKSRVNGVPVIHASNAPALNISIAASPEIANANKMTVG